ncbi:MAG: hypothetical protein ABW189_02290 [Rickettsiales bacterium]
MPYRTEKDANGKWKVVIECDVEDCNRQDDDVQYVCSCDFDNAKFACGQHNVSDVTCTCTSTPLKRPIKVTNSGKVNEQQHFISLHVKFTKEIFAVISKQQGMEPNAISVEPAASS